MQFVLYADKFEQEAQYQLQMKLLQRLQGYVSESILMSKMVLVCLTIGYFSFQHFTSAKIPT